MATPSIISSTTTKLAIIDDNEIFRTGIKSVTDTMENFELICEASSFDQFVKFEQENSLPDIVIVEVLLPSVNSSEHLESLVASYPDLKILVFTEVEDLETKRRIISMDIHGFIYKSGGSAILKTALNTIEKDEYFFDPVITTEIRSWLIKDKRLPLVQDKLSNREIEILILICKQYTTKEITEELNLAIDTIKGYRKRLFEKTGCKNVVGLGFYAIKNGFVKIEDINL